jgi:hypothetical protein
LIDVAKHDLVDDFVGQHETGDETALWAEFGGWGGIRTHGGLAPTTVFKTVAIDRSATHPSTQVRPALPPRRQ